MIQILLGSAPTPFRHALAAHLAVRYRVHPVADGPALAASVAAGPPDLLLLDLGLPGAGGLVVAAQLAAAGVLPPTILLASYVEPAYVVASRRLGVQGYLLSGNAARDLAAAVTTVLAGHAYLSPPLTEAAVTAYLAQVAAGGP